MCSLLISIILSYSLIVLRVLANLLYVPPPLSPHSNVWSNYYWARVSRKEWSYVGPSGTALVWVKMCTSTSGDRSQEYLRDWLLDRRIGEAKSKGLSSDRLRKAIYICSRTIAKSSDLRTYSVSQYRAYPRKATFKHSWTS